MKILLVADLHYSLRQFDWVCAMAPKFDRVIVAGDLLEISSIVPLEAQIVVARKYLKKLSSVVPLLVCSGNHDVILRDGEQVKDALWLREKHGLRYQTDFECFEDETVLYSILPWWESVEHRRATLANLRSDAEKVGDRSWIWVYHTPPEGTLVSTERKRDFGDPYLLEWIEEFSPRMVLGGHVHLAPFLGSGAWVDEVVSTFVFNGGHQPGAVPCFTMIDLVKNEAVWYSAEGGEKACLKSPLERTPVSG